MDLKRETDRNRRLQGFSVKALTKTLSAQREKIKAKSGGAGEYN